MKRVVRYLDRSQFTKGTDLGEPGSFALMKGGAVEGEGITTKDAMLAYLVKDATGAMSDEDITKTVDEMSDGEIAFPFVLSTASVDRQGDVINQEGWQLANYQKNPVVLWAHDYEQLPIARASAVYVSGGKLKAVDRFSNDHELARTCAKLYQKGFLSAVSVGFRPVKWAWNDDRGGMAADFESAELLEHSAVPVPAHQDALIEARSLGIEIGPVVEWAEKALESRGGLYLPKTLLEDALLRAKGGARIQIDLGDRKAPKLDPIPPADLAAAIETVKSAGLSVATPDVLAALVKNAESKQPEIVPEPAPEKEPEEEGLTLSLADIKAEIQNEMRGMFSPLRDRFQKFHTDQTGRLD